MLIVFHNELLLLDKCHWVLQMPACWMGTVANLILTSSHPDGGVFRLDQDRIATSVLHFFLKINTEINEMKLIKKNRLIDAI